MDTTLTLVELLGRGGDAQHRILLPRLPVTVGRALDNDVIVDDPTVAAHHLRIERDAQGRLRAVDLGSRNGLYSGRRRVAEALVGPTVHLRIGHTQLRVRSGDDPLAPELPAEADSRWRSPWAFVTALFAYTTVIVFLMFESAVDGFEPVRVVATLPLLLLAPALWAGLWAAVGRVAGGHAQFVAHAALTMAALAGAALLMEALDILVFAFSLPLQPDQFVVAAELLLGALIYAQLRLVSRQPRSVLAAATVAITLVGITAVHLTAWLGSRDDVDRQPVMTTLGPSALRIAPGVSPEAFAADARAIEAELARLRQESP